MTNLFKFTNFTLLAIAIPALISCSTQVDMPKGTSRSYTSARLVSRNPDLAASSTPAEQKIHGMIQKSLSNQFTAKGLTFGKGNADLTVAYLVMHQSPVMTARYEDYFGYNRSSEEIADLAHTRGVIDSKRPDYYERAGIVIDVIDSKTHKLVYRNFAAGDVVDKGASDNSRAARINSLVGQALASFFR